MVVIFNLQISYLLTLSLPREEVFQVNGQIRAVANLPVVDSFSISRNANTKATEYITFGFSFCILVFPLLEKFEPHCLSAIQILQRFNCHNLRKFRQTTLY